MRKFIVIMCLLFCLISSGCKKKNDKKEPDPEPDLPTIDSITNLHVDTNAKGSSVGWMIGWDSVENASLYQIKVDNTTFTTKNNYYDIGSVAVPNRDYRISVVAVRNLDNGSVSSEPVTINYKTAKATAGLKYIEQEDGTYALACHDAGNAVLRGTIIIPDLYLGKPVTTLDEFCFCPTKIVNDILFGQMVTHENNTVTTKVVLPKYLKSTGKSGLASCLALEEVEFNDCLEEISFSSFSLSENIKMLNLPESLKKIDDNAFARCSKLSSIVIPKNVEYIGRNAFNNCTSLSNIEIKSELVQIGGGAFGKTSWLDEKSDEFVTIGNTLLKYNGTKDSLTPKDFDSNINSIAGQCFASSNIVSIELPSSIKTLGDNTFAFCRKLETVKLNSIIEVIPYYCFNSCSALQSFDFTGVKEISDLAFSGCSSLKEANLSEGLTSIGISAFGLTAIEELVIPSTVETLINLFSSATSIRKIVLAEGFKTLHCEYEDIVVDDRGTVIRKYHSFFGELNGVYEVVLPDSLETIEDGLFSNAQHLKTVTLGKGLKTVSKVGFNSCFGLRNIIFRGTMERFNKLIDTKMFANTTILVTCDDGDININ